MKIAIYAQQYSESYKKVFSDLFSEFLVSEEVYVEQKLLAVLKSKFSNLNHLKSFAHFSDLDASFDVMLTIGGDGTILRAITYVRDTGIPILGINAGRLGFLATIQKDELKAMFEALRNKTYLIKSRSVIEVFTKENGMPLSDINFALNEVTVTRKNTTSMITIDTWLNGEFLTSYWADGLIVATPTGSTGYSLSCGGPVITPQAQNFVLTPIAPHNLNARPLVIPDDTEIHLTIYGREKSYYVSMDSRLESVSNKVSVILRKAHFAVKMIEFQDRSFLNTLRNKLLWGEDKRNK
ncbi:NAD kinase [Capnocytophaga canimorsus]|uniref:NAD kinase n=1 Tax=Capnocytophaga canimorsus TaxID=28188 RepID=UPI00385C3797